MFYLKFSVQAAEKILYLIFYLKFSGGRGDEVGGREHRQREALLHWHRLHRQPHPPRHRTRPPRTRWASSSSCPPPSPPHFQRRHFLKREQRRKNDCIGHWCEQWNWTQNFPFPPFPSPLWLIMLSLYNRDSVRYINIAFRRVQTATLRELSRTSVRAEREPGSNWNLFWISFAWKIHT